MANTATAVKTVINGQDYGQIKITNSAGTVTTVMGLAPSGGSTGYQRANVVRDRLNSLFSTGANIEYLHPGMMNGEWVVHHVPTGKTTGSLIITATNEDSAHHGQTRWHLTLVWANAIRKAVDRFPLCKDAAGNSGRIELFDAGKQGTEPVVGAPLMTTATVYGYDTKYGTTGSMECWHPYDMTCAMHAMTEADTCSGNTGAYIPYGIYVRVTNQNNNQQVIVRVNDRGPRKDIACGTPKKLIDLSELAAKMIGFDFVKGSIPVKIERLS